MKETFSFGL